MASTEQCDSRWREDKDQSSTVATNMRGMYINSTFDAGNIDVVDMRNPGKIQNRSVCTFGVH